MRAKEFITEAANAAQQAAIAIAKKKKQNVKEFAPDNSGGDEEETLLKYARIWYNGDDDIQQKVEKLLDRMGWEIGEIESEEGGAFVVQSGDEHGKSYIGFTPEDLTETAMAEGVDIGREWMSDTELDQYVPDRLQQQWRELLGYDRNGNPSALWANLTGGYEPDVNDRQHRALMVKVANKWFAAKKIPNVKFFSVRDADDELEWLVQIGPEGMSEDWQKVNKKDKTDGMSSKAVKAYRRENPGSKLKTAVTTPPSKLKKGSKASKRRSSFCARSDGQKKMHNIDCTKTPDKAICKARKRWNCE